jgi:hypothetical protein
LAGGEAMKKLLLVFFLISPFHLYAQNCMPYAGEELVFNVGWEFINAGTATMKVSNPEKDKYTINTFARTNKFLDIFKKVRDTIISQGICVDGHMQSTNFDLEQHERKYHAVKKTLFDWQHDKVLYTQNNKTDTYKVKAGHLNVMDAFFLVRQQPLELGQTLSIPVFDSRKIYEVVVHVSKKTKRLHAPWGGYVECILVEPKLKTAGVFSSKGKIKIWMTHDKRHIPIKMTAKIKIGRIIAHLSAYQAPSSPKKADTPAPIEHHTQ